MATPFQTVLNKYRKYAFSERDKGDKFERLMQAYLQTDPTYANRFKCVWLWNEFPAKNDFGGRDTGIDLVAMTFQGDYWAIQCKCYQADAHIDKPSIDTFIATSSKKFFNERLELVSFSQRLWISTTAKAWSSNAEETIANQSPPFLRISLNNLEQAPVEWEKLENGVHGTTARLAKKSPFPHQLKALSQTNDHFKTQERGKLIMACGTGKTFTSLRIAEKETDNNGLVLFLVPSIALLGQTLREWLAESKEPINPICICSDAEISKNKTKNTDTDGYSVVDLALPASTDTKDILKQFDAIRLLEKTGMTVVFSTYQSIDVIAKVQAALLARNAQKDNPFGIFDLIICDEAHRTTGVTLADNDESAFVKVHNNAFIQAKRRLYMTATPRLFNDDSKSKAAQADAVLCSMDDPSVYGEEIYRIGFGEAVEKNLLSDYKVLVLTISDADVPPAIQAMIQDPDNHEINADDTSKLIGCINALSKQILVNAEDIKDSDPEPMRRAVAFCSNIKDSKKITKIFNDTATVYHESLSSDKKEKVVVVASDHIDGTMSATLRDEKLAWLKATADDAKECRVLTNVRCLSEGVDVPSLDAVVFLSARNSQVDVVQSVGRVMRKAKDKKYGYIIIPVVVPSDIEADKALDDNDRFKVVWTVLNALRAHDDRFNATVNKIELNKRKPSQILIGRPAVHFDRDGSNYTEGSSGGGNSVAEPQTPYNAKAQTTIQNQLAIQFEQLQSVLFARLVQKVGDRRYWEQWAKDVAAIAENYIVRIKNLIKDGSAHKPVFEAFLKGLQKNINPSITQDEAVEMLAQHYITKPVFEALFEGYSFVKNNPISVAMQQMLDVLESQAFDKDTEDSKTLQKFYESVKKRAADIDNAEAKQRIIVELYDKFFKTAFPKMVEQLGIVYTPIEVVDFIIHSVDALLKKEFNRALTDENIHILDPFTGTGTFMTRLLQSGLINPKDLERKYSKELHANEIVLLAYYIAAVNIENAFHDLRPTTSESTQKPTSATLKALPTFNTDTENTEGGNYVPFDGICLTDTFQLGEKGDIFSDKFPQNSERVLAQKTAPLRVIIGNPPYSVGQKSANDNAQNQEYTHLDSRIAKTYAAATNATNKNSLYDSYIKAFRWSSDRLNTEGGIIAFVSNGAWIDGNATAGFRKSLEKEFSAIYVFNLRGNARTQGELRRKEAGNVFGSGSRTPISITFLVKNPDVITDKATIHYCDIGDYLSNEEKLKIISKFGSVENTKMDWQTLDSNEHGDWLNQRDDLFGTFIPLGDKDDKKSFFVHGLYCRGLETSRDAWAYNSNKEILKTNVQKTMDFFNEQTILFRTEKVTKPDLAVQDFVIYDDSKISWSRAFLNEAASGKTKTFDDKRLVTSVYRPFFKQHLYFSRELNNVVSRMDSFFPTPSVQNRVICVLSVGGSKDFSVVMTDSIPDVQLQMNGQCFPLYYYEEQQVASPTLFDAARSTELVRRDGVSDFILGQAQKLYGKTVDKEAIFYYVYGILHSPDYCTRFSSDLKKMLPRLPLADAPKDFWAFSKAGRQLADLHIEYEKAAFPSDVKVTGTEGGYFQVEKMRFPSKTDKSTLLFNSHIRIDNIPLSAYDYVVNGKSALEWVMERYAITTHKDSGIRNDPNDWATEVGNERYILDLVLRVITVSLATVAIVKGLPKLEIAG